MVSTMKGKLTPFPTVPKEQRLVERARIVCENFSCDVVGFVLMDYLLIEMFNNMNDPDDVYAQNFCASIHEARSWLEFYRGNNEEE